jgi:hypothetical protein
MDFWLDRSASRGPIHKPQQNGATLIKIVWKVKAFWQGKWGMKLNAVDGTFLTLPKSLFLHEQQ